jgi:hypothetical protein
MVQLAAGAVHPGSSSSSSSSENKNSLSSEH